MMQRIPETKSSASEAKASVLRRLLEARPKSREGEACDMCAGRIGPEHSHVVDLEGRGLMCACRPCWLLFTHPGAGRGKFRAVPDRVRTLPGFRLDEETWGALKIPVRLAFFFTNSRLNRTVAFYPGPAGATQSELPLDAWQRIVGRHAGIGEMVADVEALLAFSPDERSPFECFVVPIDACYELTGVVRRNWKGFDGGTVVWREIESFFERLRRRARPYRKETR